MNKAQHLLTCNFQQMKKQFLPLLQIFPLQISIAVHVGSSSPADGSLVGRLLNQGQKLGVDRVGFAEMFEHVIDLLIPQFQS